MKHAKENASNRHMGFKRREFMAMLAGCTVGLMAPGLSLGEEKMPGRPHPAPTGWARFCLCASWVLRVRS
jgi:hypothetical protein